MPAQLQISNSKLFLHWVSYGTNNFWTSTKSYAQEYRTAANWIPRVNFPFWFCKFCTISTKIISNFLGRKNTEELAQQHRCQNIMKTTTTATKQTESLIENSSVLASPSSEYIIKLFMFMGLRTSAANGVIKLSNLFYICVPYCAVPFFGVVGSDWLSWNWAVPCWDNPYALCNRLPLTKWTSKQAT